MQIAPSVLAADFTKLGQEIQRVSGADVLRFWICNAVRYYMHRFPECQILKIMLFVYLNENCIFKSL